MRDYSPDPRLYELMTVLAPDVPEEEIPGQIERISGYLTGADGTIQETASEAPWGRRRLAYPIRHEGRDVRDGFYTLFHFEMHPSRVVEMEREIKLNTRIIRYLVTSYTPVPLDPRAIEDAEIAAEDAAAAAYAEAQAEAARLAAASSEPEPESTESSESDDVPTAPAEAVAEGETAEAEGESTETKAPVAETEAPAPTATTPEATVTAEPVEASADEAEETPAPEASESDTATTEAPANAAGETPSDEGTETKED